MTAFVNAREHLLTLNFLVGFRIRIKGVMAVSTRQELPLWDPSGVLQPFAALGACTKTTSNG